MSSRSLIIISLIVALLFLAFSAYTYLQSQTNPEGFGPEDMVVPVFRNDPELTPWMPSPLTNEPFARSISMTWLITPIYSGWGGVMHLNVTNQGESDIYVYGYGVEWKLSGGGYQSSYRDCAVNISIGETGSLGYLYFTAPDAGTHGTYRINLLLAVERPNGTSDWHDFGPVMGEWRDTELLPRESYVPIEAELNPRSAYDKVQSHLDFDAVAGVVQQVQGEEAGAYNIQQIISAYDWVRDNIAYVDDVEDHWQDPAETLQIGSGDCEDQALLIASIIDELGGNARLNFIVGHAFATVFIGNSSEDMTACQEAVTSHYGCYLPVYFLYDQDGYWMTIDTTGFPYAGGLTTSSAPTFTDGGWTFPDSDYLTYVDAVG